MKYQIGDRVVVRSDLQRYQTYFMEDHEHSNCVVSPMDTFAGKTVTIRSANEQYKIEGCMFFWTDEMFEGLAYVPSISVDDLI